MPEHKVSKNGVKYRADSWRARAGGPHLRGTSGKRIKVQPVSNRKPKRVLRHAALSS